MALVKGQLQELDTEIQQYRVRHNKLPDQLEDLPLTGNAKVTDAWVERIVYETEKTETGEDYTLHSKGPDKVDGTSDDVKPLISFDEP